MKHTIKMSAMLWAMLCVACLASTPVWADGVLVPGTKRCNCPGQGWTPAGDDQSCEEACGLTSGSSGGGGDSAGTILGRALGKALGEALFGNSEKEAAPSYDYEAARRAQEAEAAAAAERQRQQAEADRIERERQAESERQKEAAFVSDRNDAVNTLKGSSGLAASELKGLSGTGLKGSGDNPYGLRDAVSDTGLKGSTPASEAQAKQAAAWKQLHCAASIAKSALAALQADVDYNEFGYLSVEASKALDGQRTDVVCEKAPAFPNSSGKTVNMDRVIASERQLLARATVIAERMKQRGDKPGTAQQPVAMPPANETPIEKARRVAKEINEINDRKISNTQQEKDRKELTKLVLENEKLTSVDFSVGGDAPPTSRRRKNVEPPSPVTQ